MKQRLGPIAVLWFVVAIVLLASVSFGPSAYRKVLARYHLREGQKAYSAKDYQTAERHLLRAKELDTHLLEAQLQLVRLFDSSHPYPVLAQREIEIIPDLLKLDPSNRYALKVMAKSWLVLEDREQARQWLRRWAAAYPADPEPVCLIAGLTWYSAYERREEGQIIRPNSEEHVQLRRQVDEGIELLKSSIDRNPAHEESHTQLALLYQAKADLAGNTDERKRWLREADLSALAASRLRRQD